MKVGVPELAYGLVLEPLLDDEKTVDDAGAVRWTPGLFGSLDDGLGDDLAMGTGDLLLLELAGDAFFNQVAETEGGLGDIGGGDGRLDGFVTVGWKDFAGFC